MEVRPSLNTASVKLTVAGETAKVRYEYAVGGDTADLRVLIDKIKRHKMSSDFVIVPATYTRNGRVVPSDRPGAILFYSNLNFPFGELVPNGFIKLEKGERAGQTVSSYKMAPPQVWVTVDNLFNNEPMKFMMLSQQMKDAYLMGTLIEVPASFKPAICDPQTGALSGMPLNDPTDMASREEQDAIDGLNETPESPDSDDDNSAPF